MLKKNIIDKNDNKKENPLNLISKYKIFDNVLRGLYPISVLLVLVFLFFIEKVFNINVFYSLCFIVISFFILNIIDVINKIIFYKKGKKIKRSFNKKISPTLGYFLRGLISLMVLPDKAYTNINAIVKTIYRLLVSKKHLLEWVTSEEAEKISKNDLLSFYKNMKIILAPFFMWFISRKEKEKNSIELIKEKEKDYLSDLAKNTWLYFKDTLVKENNYLPPDNYEENRNIKFALRTSPTNIGLAILSVITSYDLGFESIQYVLDLLEKMLKTIEKLPKWNGHLYNWYDIKTLKPLIPRYISTVDSGNFISYLFVLKQFYIKIKEQIDLGKIDNSLLKYIPEWVGKKISDMPFIDADFSKLYDYEKELFSIGFNIEDNKLTLSYYDMLASEARSTSLIAIAKKDIEPKHWYNLGRTLTSLQNYKGLISWSGTSF